MDKSFLYDILTGIPIIKITIGITHQLRIIALKEFFIYESVAVPYFPYDGFIIQWLRLILTNLNKKISNGHGKTGAFIMSGSYNPGRIGIIILDMPFFCILAASKI